MVIAAAGIAAAATIGSTVYASQASKKSAESQAGAATQAADAQAQAADRATQLQRDIYNQSRADLQPWRTAGQQALSILRKDTRRGQYFNEPFTMQDFRQDPGYQFRLQQGQAELDRQASAKGQYLSGAALKGGLDYSSGLASQEYGNAFNRFQTERSNRFNRLASLAGTGQTAVGQGLQAGQQFGQQAGENIIGAGNARASGYIGAANAQAAGLQGTANALNVGAQNALVLGSQFLRPQTPSPYDYNNVYGMGSYGPTGLGGNYGNVIT